MFGKLLVGPLYFLSFNKGSISVLIVPGAKMIKD